MTRENLDLLVGLAELLDSFNCKTLSELSRKTWRLKEDGYKIPYITPDGEVRVYSDQTMWLFLRDFQPLEPGDIRYSLRIFKDSDFVIIGVLEQKKFEHYRDMSREELYSADYIIEGAKEMILSHKFIYLNRFFNRPETKENYAKAVTNKFALKTVNYVEMLEH